MSEDKEQTYQRLLDLYLESRKASDDLNVASRTLDNLLRIMPEHAELLRQNIEVSVALKQWRRAFKSYDLLLSIGPAVEIDYLYYKKNHEGSDWSPFACCGARNRLYAAVILITLVMICAAASLTSTWAAVGACAVFLSALFLGEVAYRTHLYFKYGIHGERHAYPPRKTEVGFFPAADKDEQVFDPVRGFNLRPNSRFVRIGIKDNRVVEAHTAMADKNGNVGFTDEDFSEDAVNVLVLGDSYTNFPGNGATQDDLEGIEWPYFFRRALQRNGLTNIRILNYARSGHGILQMADTAAELVEKSNIDVVIFAFIVRDLMRDRYWHFSYNVGGKPRSCRTKSQDPNTPLSDAADQDIIDERITAAWARERLEKQDTDPLIQDLTARYLDLRRRACARAIDLLSASRSYLLDRIFFATPFIDLEVTPRVAWVKNKELFDYATDAQFVDAAACIKKAGARILPVVLPIKEDLISGGPNFSFDNERMLLKSLQKLTGQPILFLQSAMSVDKADAEARYARQPHDAHPSAWAMKQFGDAMARLVLAGTFGDAFTAKRARRASP